MGAPKFHTHYLIGAWVWFVGCVRVHEEVMPATEKGWSLLVRIFSTAFFLHVCTQHSKMLTSLRDWYLDTVLRIATSLVH